MYNPNDFYFSEREEYIDGGRGCSVSYGCDGIRWVYVDDGSRHCELCGAIDAHFREYDARPPIDNGRFRKDSGRGIISWGFNRGRYKEKFHFNERIAQWCLRDPLIPAFDWCRIVSEAKSGKYGPIEDFTRSTVVTMTRNLGFQKYRERWKRILYDLTHRSADLPETELLDWLDQIFEHVVSSFMTKKRGMPQSVSKDGSSAFRHNFMSYNYTIVKLLEAMDIYEYHWEFPLPRSHVKLHALDDVFELVAKELNLPFVRSVVIKRSKYKKP